MFYYLNQGYCQIFQVFAFEQYFKYINQHSHVSYHLTFLPSFINKHSNITSEELGYNFQQLCHKRTPPRRNIYVLHSDDSLSASSIQFPKNSDPDFTQFRVIIILQKKKIHSFLNGSTFSHLDIFPKGIKSNFLLLKLLCLTFYFV